MKHRGRQFITAILLIIGFSSPALAVFLEADSLYFYGSDGRTDNSIQSGETVNVVMHVVSGTPTGVNGISIGTFTDSPPASGDANNSYDRTSTVSGFNFSSGDSTVTFAFTAPSTWGAGDSTITVYCQLDPALGFNRYRDYETFTDAYGAYDFFTTPQSSGLGFVWGVCELDSTTPVLVAGDGNTEATALNTVRLVFNESVQEVTGDCGANFKATGDGIGTQIWGTSMTGSGTDWTLTLASDLPDRDWSGSIVYDQNASGNQLEDLSSNEMADEETLALTTEAIAPDTPTMNSPIATSKFLSGVVAWTATADNGTTDPSIAGVRLQGSTNNVDWNDIGTEDTNTDNTSYSGTYTLGTEYGYYRIKIRDDQGNVAYSPSRGNYQGAHHLAFTTSEVNEPVNTYEDEVGVSVHDAYGNPESGEDRTINLSQTSGTGDGTFRETPVGDNVTYVSMTTADTSATFYYACSQTGSKTILVYANLLTSATQNATIIAEDPSQILVKLPGQTFFNGSGMTGTPSTQTAGASFNIQLYVVDDNLYLVENEDGSRDIDFASTAGNAPDGTQPTIDGVTSGSWADRSVSFTDGISADVAVVFYNAASATITGSDNSGTPTLTGVASTSLTTSHAAADHYVFSLASGPSESGVAWTGTNTLTIQDEYLNTATSFDASANNTTVASSGGTITGLGSGDDDTLDQAGDFSSGVCDLTSQGIILTASADTYTISCSFQYSLPENSSSTTGTKVISVNAPTLSNPNHADDEHIRLTGTQDMTVQADVSSGENGEVLQIHWAWDNDGSLTSGYAVEDSAAVAVISDQVTKYLNSTTLSDGQTYDYMFWWVSGEDSQSNPVEGTPIAATRARMLVNPTLSVIGTDVGQMMLPGYTHCELVSITLAAEMVGATITISSLDFTKTSSSSATSADISKFQLWHDVNDNGSWDSGTDIQIGLDQVGTVNPSFSAINFATTNGTWEKLLLTVDISTGAEMSHTLGMEISQSSDFHLALSADDVSGTFPMPSSPGDHSLPVSFTSFDIIADNGSNLLNWVTESEQNNAGFAVWRAEVDELNLSSPPAIDQFTRLAHFDQYSELVGAGNSAQPNDYSFIDDQIDPGAIYHYILEAIDLDGSSEFYENWVEILSLSIPEDWELSQNYPNPFNPSTTIKFSLPEPGAVTLHIYNMQGERVQTLLNRESFSWGHYQVVWDGRNQYGAAVASGVYFYRMQGDGFVKTRKMTLIR